MENDIILCECHSSEHQVIISHDTEDNTVYLHIHLTTYHNFWKRLWFGLKYAFGYKCRYGAWDEFIINPKDKDKIQKIVDTLDGNIT